MIVSIHVPKTAGISFRAQLHATFGSRILFDNNDLQGIDGLRPSLARAYNLARAVWLRRVILRDYDVVHGHLSARKYRLIFPGARFAAFFREPHQQTASHYAFYLRHPELYRPYMHIDPDRPLSIGAFCAKFPNIQKRFLDGLNLTDLAMVGLSEDFARSVALFEAVFDCNLAPAEAPQNVNPDRTSDTYDVTPELHDAVAKHRAADIALYREAQEHFARLCDIHNV